MNPLRTIALTLAEKTGDLINIIIMVAVFVIAIIASAIKKVLDKQREQEAAKGRGEQQREHREAVRRAQERRARQAQADQQAAPGARAAPARGRPARAVPPSPPPPPPSARPQPEEPYVLGAGVEEETRRELQRERAEEMRRRRRLRVRRPPEADPALSSRLVSIRGGDLGTLRVPRRSIVNLQGRGEARTAIIYHEILSPPKALRKGPEMWDL